MTEPARTILMLNWRDPKHPQAGGAERYVSEIGRRLVARGHTVHWLTAGFRGAPSEEIVSGLHVTRVGNAVTVYALAALRYVTRFRGRVDAIVDAENGIPFFAPLYAREPVVLLMFHVHQGVFERHLPFPVSTFFKWIEARVMPAVYRHARMVAISEDTRADMTSLLGIDAARVDLAYSGVDAALRPMTKKSRPTIAYVGRLKAYKHVEIVVCAFARLRQSIPELELVIAGSGDREASLEELCERLRVRGAVRFEGYVDEERKAEILATAWVFATASEMEGWGLTVIEAGSCGTPSVCFNVPGLREAIVDGTSGLLVALPPGVTPNAEAHADAFAAALRRVLDDEALRQRLIAGARERAAAFSWDRAADTFLQNVSGLGSFASP